MSVYRDKTRGCFVFEFNRKVGGKRLRLRKILPKAWTQTQADKYDREESAKLYAVATRVETPDWLIETAVATYLQDKAKDLKSFEQIEKEFMQMCWAYGGKYVSELSDVCRRVMTESKRDNDKDERPLAAATLRNRIRYLTSACRHAWKHHGVGEHDPAERVIVPKVRNARALYADRMQMLAIAKACQCRPSRAAIRIAFYSGMRMGEIVRAERVDGMFQLADTKNDDPRHIPIHPKIATAAKVQLRDRFWMSKRFKEAAIAVGLGDLRFHDLRHSAASAMINAEVDLYTVGAVLGHKSAQSTQRYSHLATKALKTAVGKIGKKVPTTKKMRVA